MSSLSVVLAFVNGPSSLFVPCHLSTQKTPNTSCRSPFTQLQWLQDFWADTLAPFLVFLCHHFQKLRGTHQLGVHLSSALRDLTWVLCIPELLQLVNIGSSGSKTDYMPCCESSMDTARQQWRWQGQQQWHHTCQGELLLLLAGSSLFVLCSSKLIEI